VGDLPSVGYTHGVWLFAGFAVDALGAAFRYSVGRPARFVSSTGVEVSGREFLIHDAARVHGFEPFRERHRDLHSTHSRP